VTHSISTQPNANIYLNMNPKKENWGGLTDDDIEVMLGKGEQLAGRLQERYGYSRERAEPIHFGIA
jgi:hypothetical protein